MLLEGAWSPRHHTAPPHHNHTLTDTRAALLCALWAVPVDMGVRSCISRASRTVLGSDDLDELFAYSTIRMTVIRDRRLGLLNLFFKGAIVVYVVMQLWWQGSYLEELAVRGSGRFALHQPTSNCTWDERQAPSTSPYCATCDVTDTQSSHCFDVFPNVTDLPYCTQSELFFKKDKKLCRFEEAAASSTVFQSSLLAATQGTELKQKKVCSANPSDPLYNDGVCNRVYETIDNDVFFFAFIDNFTVSVYHSLQYPQQVTNEEMEGALLVKEDPFNKTNSDIICADDPDATDRFPGGHPTNVSPCWIRPDRSEDGSDLFQLNTFLKAAATKLDHDTIGPNITVRTMGTTLIVGVEYENWAPWEVMTKQAPARYKYFITPMYNNSFQNTEAIYDQYPDTRTLLLRNGVRLVAVQSGMLRNFSFANLLITLATSLTLLAITTTIVDLISTSVMTDSNLYKDYKVQYTPDVSDVRAGLACATCASETYRIITTKENPGYCGICEGDFVENTVMYRCVKCDHLRCKACLPRSTSNKPATSGMERHRG
eukprot:TRINITY_DN25009_c0_g1_i1.p1 TRINITY_DN25009_c0_g1~~TRINITY_DN25009_c0_g1_i1.p1  ORF type:complete len:542 (+),score=139.88 TRINITY_DN25009_c0_g1_i1:574-2199(+)